MVTFIHFHFLVNTKFQMISDNHVGIRHKTHQSFEKGLAREPKNEDVGDTYGNFPATSSPELSFDLLSSSSSPLVASFSASSTICSTSKDNSQVRPKKFQICLSGGPVVLKPNLSGDGRRNRRNNNSEMSFNPVQGVFRHTLRRSSEILNRTFQKLFSVFKRLRWNRSSR